MNLNNKKMKKTNVIITIISVALMSAGAAILITVPLVTDKTDDEKALYLEAYSDGYNNRSLGLPQDSTLFFNGFNAGAEYLVRFIENSSEDFVTIQRNYGELKLTKSITKKEEDE